VTYIGKILIFLAVKSVNNNHPSNLDQIRTKAKKTRFAMHAMILETPGLALRQVEFPLYECGVNDILLRVNACGVCRTDLHIVDGELSESKLPLIPGHEIVGVVASKGEQVERYSIGQRLGVPWLAYTCGHCRYCLSGRENLCDHARFTGYTVNGGYAEYALADQHYCFNLPDGYTDAEAAPLLCAGLIGSYHYPVSSLARAASFCFHQAR
jgi:propanol-preferring alcohol dehydrogenase